MPISFPSNPTLNQEHFTGGKTWVWNGVNWAPQSSIGAINLNNVASNILPVSSGVYNIGSDQFKWKNLFVSGQASADTVKVGGGGTAITIGSDAAGLYARNQSGINIGFGTGGGGASPSQVIIKTYNILNEFSAPIIGGAVFVPPVSSVLRSVQLTNGTITLNELIVGLYRNGDLLSFFTLPVGKITTTITNLNHTLSPNDYITVNVVAGQGKNFTLSLISI